MHLLRSWMFVPGNNERYLEKARGLDLDVALLDLEDGVPSDQKDDARERIRGALSADWPDYPSPYVRINDVGTSYWRDDLEAVVVGGLAGVCVSKVESEQDILRVSSALLDLETSRGIPPGTVRIVAAIESARGLLASPAIARAHPRMAALIFGGEDFALDVGFVNPQDPAARAHVTARSSVVIAAASAGIASVDQVFADMNDHDGFVADADFGRNLGFDGKSTFNPRHIDYLNRCFAPSDEQLVEAQEVVAAFEEAARSGHGSVAVRGRLVDRPIAIRAERALSLGQRVHDRTAHRKGGGNP